MATSNVWEVTLNMEASGQRIACIFFYRGNAVTSPTAADIAQSFHEQILPDIEAVAVDDVFYDSIGVRDIMGTDTAVLRPVGENGQIGAGDMLPPHDAYGFKLDVATTLTRPGSKRIPGVYETAVVDGVITSAPLISLLNDLALTLAFNLFDHVTGLIPWAAAVIVKRILVGDGIYRLPESIGELVTNPVTTATPNLNVSTQVSRKIKSN